MKTPLSGTDFESQRIFTCLLQSLQNDTITGWEATFGRLALWYYQSPFVLIPDIFPGLGYLDHYILAQVSLWLCRLNPDTVEIPEDLSREIEAFFAPPAEPQQNILPES